MSERQTLREYQQALFERLRASAASDAGKTTRLGLEAGSVRWLLRLDEAQEVISVAPLTPVPLTKSWFRGLVNIRGNLFSVVDLGLFAGGGGAVSTTEARLVLLAERFHVNAALLVQRLLGLRSLSDFLVDESEPARHSWASKRLRDADGNVWHELSVSGLAQQNEFLQAGV
jgi:twitching motility protein PilI